MPDCIEPIIQKEHADCAVAALAMLSTRAYRTVSDAAVKLKPRVHSRGLYVPQLLALAAAIKYPLRKRRLTDRLLQEMDELTGILAIYCPVSGDGHAVVLFEGVVINPADGLVWNRETYLLNGGWRMAAFLEPKT